MKGIKNMPLIRCHFEDGPKFISWKPNQELEPVPPTPPPTPMKKMAITLGEQMEEALTEWYNELGKSVPPEELQICREADAVEHKEYLKAVALAKTEPIYEYGTPEFWKDFHRRKAEKAAALKAAGLTEADIPSAPIKKRAEKAVKDVDPSVPVPANKQASAKKQKSLVPKSAK